MTNPASHFAALRKLLEEFELSHERSLAALRLEEAELWFARCAATRGEQAAAERSEKARNAAQARWEPQLPVATSPGLLTAEQAAAELQIARRRIFEMIADGTLPSVKIGKSRRITRTALESYVKGLES